MHVPLYALARRVNHTRGGYGPWCEGGGVNLAQFTVNGTAAVNRRMARKIVQRPRGMLLLRVACLQTRAYAVPSMLRRDEEVGCDLLKNKYIYNILTNRREFCFSLIRKG